ncbi:MAG TPA: hypothetical protein VL371_26160 [Gemmataceae bacterium]|nr:hypothetical protein [Gemmataceae bacterium]
MGPRAFAGLCAYAAAACFVVGMATAVAVTPTAAFPPPPSLVVQTVAFTAWHLLLLPVVAAVDAPAWAKGSGYAWIAIDNVIGFWSYFGTGQDLVIPSRWGVHIAAATWIAGASMSARGAVRAVGMLAAGLLVLVSFAGPFVGQARAFQTLGAPSLAMIVWVWLVGRSLRSAH